MINKDYFTSELPAQIAAAGRPLSVTLVLRTGQSFRVRRIGRAIEGYAIFETYPPAVAGAVRGGQATRKRLTEGPGPHWLVLAYDAISHVTLSAAEEEALDHGN